MSTNSRRVVQTQRRASGKPQPNASSTGLVENPGLSGLPGTRQCKESYSVFLANRQYNGYGTNMTEILKNTDNIKGTKKWASDLGRRSGADRRKYLYAIHIPEKRSGLETRAGLERRLGINRRLSADRRSSSYRSWYNGPERRHLHFRRSDANRRRFW